jgi:hypothetical protein
MTTDQQIKKIDDEILSLAYTEDKLDRAMRRETPGSDAWLTARRQLRVVSGELDKMQAASDVVHESIAVCEAVDHRRVWPPAEPKLVTFFAIEEVCLREVAA